MGRYGFSLLIVVAVTACAGKNTVAGRDKTKAEQLEAALPSWCQTTCARIEECSSRACDCQDETCSCYRAAEDCAADCEREMARFTIGDDACATIGETYERCIDSMTCYEFRGKGDCVLSQTDERLCPEIDDSTAEPPAGGEAGPMASGVGGNDTGPASGSGAAASIGGSAGDAVVLCSSAYDRNLDGDGADAVAIGVICDEGRRECEDGRVYSWLCARGSEGQLGCTCFVDAQVTSGFALGSSSCPDQAAVNAACHWNIALVSP